MSVSPPGNFVGAATSTTQVALSWTPASGATGYRLYQIQNGVPVQIATYNASITNATVGALTPATTYAFNLVAFNGSTTAATPWINVTTSGGVSAPGNFTGTALSNTQIGLSWTAANGAIGYRLYQIKDGQPVQIAVYTTANTSATISNLSPGTTYAFNLVAFNNFSTAATPWISVTTTGAIPPPTNFTGTGLSTTQIGLSWTLSSGAAGYRLFEIQNGQPVQIALYNAATSSATISALTPATTYQFNLVAFNGSVTAATPWIAVATTGGVPAPGNFTGTALSNTQIGLSWTASAGAIGYRLYEMQNGQPVQIATYNSATTSATIPGLSPGTTYQFNLVAYNNNGTAATPWISVTTTGGLPAPGNFTGTPVSPTQVGLSWTASSGAIGYRLYEMQNGQPVQIATYNAATTSATISALTPATTYQFNLVAFNLNSTAATSWISVTTTGGVPAPGNFTGTALSTTQVGLTWTASAGAIGYRLFEMQNGQPVQIATYNSAATSATISALTANTTYQFNLVAFNNNTTASTPWISVTTLGGVTAPSNFTGTALSTTQILLKWSGAGDATGYRLYEMQNGQPVLISTYISTATSALIGGLRPATTYQFNLVAFNANATAATPWISVATAGVVTVPGNFAGAPLSSTQIGLTWTSSTGATGYRLYEMVNGQPLLINTFSAAAVSATVSGLQSGTTYQFNLVAFNSFTTAATAWIGVTTS